MFKKPEHLAIVGSGMKQLGPLQSGPGGLRGRIQGWDVPASLRR